MLTIFAKSFFVDVQLGSNTPLNAGKYWKALR